MFDQWITALDSGEYKKGNGYLCKDGYCCLGVLCKIQGRLVPVGDCFADGGRHYTNVLNNDNPLFPHLLAGGNFPMDCIAYPLGDYKKGTTEIWSVNDNTPDFSVVSTIIKLLWKEPTHEPTHPLNRP